MAFTATQLAIRGAKSNFWATYQATETQMDARLAAIMDRIGSDKSAEAYVYAQSAPVARYWIKGDGIPSDGGLSVNFQVRNWKFGVGVEISTEDVEDDQVHSIMSRILESAVSFAMLPERHFYWAFTGGATTDAVQMQPFLPNAPDGASWFSKTDGGGGNRFQVSNGNIEPTLGVASPQAIITAVLNAMARLASFKNTQGQPYWNPGQIMRDVRCVFNSVNLANFTGAFQQLFVVSASGQAAPSNILIDAMTKITPIPNPRITTNNYAICAADSPFKAPFWQERAAPKDVLAEWGNSDLSREFDVYKLYVRSRGAFGLGLPVAWVGIQ